MISVVMPVYNEEKYIKGAVLSVLNQSFQDLEVVVVDDQSTDSTFEILQAIAKEDSRLKVFLNPQKGKVFAVNYAVENAMGDWFSILAGDDYLEPGILERWMERAVEHDTNKEYIAFASKIREFADGDEYKRFEDLVLPKRDVAVIMGSNYLMSKKIRDEMFPLPTGYPNEDGWTRLCFDYLKFKKIFVPGVAMNYRRHANNAVNPNADFKEFNKQYHARRIVVYEFLEKYKDVLREEQIEELISLGKIEEQRYNGQTWKVIFGNNCTITVKLRNFFFSNGILYRIKLALEKYMLGWSMNK